MMAGMSAVGNSCPEQMRWLPTLAEGDVHDWSAPAEWPRWNVSLRFAVARAWPAEQSRSSNTELGTPGTRFAFYMPDRGVSIFLGPRNPVPAILKSAAGFLSGPCARRTAESTMSRR